MSGLSLLARRSDTLLALRWRKIALSAVTAIGCVGAASLLGPYVGSWEPLVDMAIILSFPATMVATGVIDRDHLPAFKQVARAIVTRRPEPLGLRDNLNNLAHDDRLLLQSLLLHRRPPRGTRARRRRDHRDQRP